MEEKIKNEVHTSLSGKEFEPMVIRRVSTPFLHFVGIISGDNLDELDNVIQKFWKDNYDSKKKYSIQEMRNLAGILQDCVVNKFPKTEGAGIVFSADKLFVSSLYGDMMVHLAVKNEFFALLNMSTGV